MKTTNNTEQVSGNHYNVGEIEPVHIMAYYQLDWFQGEVLKYCSRHWNKNGIIDLNKAIHVIDMAKDFNTLPRVRFSMPSVGTKFLNMYINQFEKYYQDQLPLFKDFIYSLIEYDKDKVRSSIVNQIKLFYGQK